MGQNLKHVHMACYFLKPFKTEAVIIWFLHDNGLLLERVKLLIFFCLTLVHIFSLEFIFHHIKEIFYANTNSKGNQS